MTHNQLDALLNNDINGVKNTAVANTDGLYGATDNYRYATFFDVHGAALNVALPSINDGVELFDPTSPAPTTVGSATGGVDNTEYLTYSDLLAIWDASNGVETTRGGAGRRVCRRAGSYPVTGLPLLRCGVGTVISTSLMALPVTASIPPSTTSPCRFCEAYFAARHLLA